MTVDPTPKAPGELDPFDFCDDVWTRVVIDVGKGLPDWKLDSPHTMSASAQKNRFLQTRSILKMNALAQKLRRGAK